MTPAFKVKAKAKVKFEITKMFSTHDLLYVCNANLSSKTYIKRDKCALVDFTPKMGVFTSKAWLYQVPKGVLKQK